MPSAGIRGASQYLKDSSAMRIETVINAPPELGCNAHLSGTTKVTPIRNRVPAKRTIGKSPACRQDDFFAANEIMGHAALTGK